MSEFGYDPRSPDEPWTPIPPRNRIIVLAAVVSAVVLSVGAVAFAIATRDVVILTLHVLRASQLTARHCVAMSDR